MPNSRPQWQFWAVGKKNGHRLQSFVRGSQLSLYHSVFWPLQSHEFQVDCFFLFPVRQFGIESYWNLQIARLKSKLPEKYVNIPSEKYIYVHIYVCICVYTYLCKMDERRSYASLS